jgi:amidase
MAVNDLIALSARQAVAHLRNGDISPAELLDAAIARIEEVNPTVNAMPELCIEQARDQAAALGRRPPDVSEDSWLAGLPIAVKDYNDLAGVRTTYGSPIYRDNVAATSDATVARLQHHGAIALGKSNVPEFAGANTFNPVYGATLNPWNTAMSAGGSSGGSAVAVATGMVWLATGNDLGGSLRTPSSFNGTVGLRPSPGRVPRGARVPAFDSLWVEGPMARNVADVALMLDAGAGFNAEDPLSFASEPDAFQNAVSAPAPVRRVAFSPDLGIVPVEPEVADICRAGAARFADLGADVTGDIPDFTGAVNAFQTLRGLLFGTLLGETLQHHRDQIAPEIIWNIEKGLNVTGAEVLDAQHLRWQLYHRMTAFFKTHDFLICPAASVAPFPVGQRYVETIAGKPCETYIDWIAITFAITMTSCPAISLPCGFTAEGLPVGMQIVGPPRGEAKLLAAAHQLEQIIDIAGTVPRDPA